MRNQALSNIMLFLSLTLYFTVYQHGNGQQSKRSAIEKNDQL